MEIAGDVFLVGQVSEGWGLLVRGRTPYLLFSLPGLPSKSYSHIGLGRDQQCCFEWMCEDPPHLYPIQQVQPRSEELPYCLHWWHGEGGTATWAANLLLPGPAVLPELHMP